MAKNPKWTVKDVKVDSGYTVIVDFEDGNRKKVDLSDVVSEGVFMELQDKKMFNKVHVAHGSIEWNDRLDIAPEYLYEQGVPV